VDLVSEPPWPTDRDWIKAGELADIADVHIRTIHREIDRGNLTATKHGGWVIALTEAKRWLDGFEKYQSLRK
jgi:hypothetical protein